MATEDRDLLATRPDVINPRDGSIDPAAGTIGSGSLPNTNNVRCLRNKDYLELRSPDVNNSRDGSIDAAAGKVDNGDDSKPKQCTHPFCCIYFFILMLVNAVISTVLSVFNACIEFCSQCPLLDYIDSQWSWPFLSDESEYKKCRPFACFFRCMLLELSTQELPVIPAVKKLKLELQQQPAADVAAVVAAAPAAAAGNEKKTLLLAADLATAFQSQAMDLLVMVEEENEANLSKQERRDKMKKAKTVLMNTGFDSALTAVPLPTDNALADQAGN